MANRISVVVSQGQSENPAKRNLEESIITALMLEHGIDVTVVPHLYDLKPDGTGMLALKSISSSMVVLGWMFERAAHWTLNRNGILGHVGPVELRNESEDEDEDQAEDSGNEEKDRVADSLPIPNRNIYCLDLRVSNKPEDFVAEIRRIQQERSVKTVSLGIGNGFASDKPATHATNGHAPNGTASSNGERVNGVTAEQMQRFENPTNGTAISRNGNQLENEAAENATSSSENGDAGSFLQRIEDNASRRWYPVIDYSRCTNCMECIDFCLFGVYGVDRVDSILVEQPDNCRKGCPACSRVCPENAIIFPQHKTPAIAGSPEVGGSLKIDLSKLFGAPDDGKSAEEIAALERDEQLIAAGRDAVGMEVGMPKRHENRDDGPKDELDSLVDQLDELDL